MRKKRDQIVKLEEALDRVDTDGDGKANITVCQRLCILAFTCIQAPYLHLFVYIYMYILLT
jgi:hypothetical protein